MEMHQARYFLALCETLNFTRAAERCNVAQPSLTRAISNLEKELGGDLFRRERNRTHLTDLGRLVQRHIEQMIAASLAAQEEAKLYTKVEAAPLRLGMMCTISAMRVVGFLQRIRAELPGIAISLRETKGMSLIDELLAGEIDVAVVGLPEFPERVDARPLFEERYVVAFRPGHRFEKMNAVPLADLDGENYLQRLNCEFPQYRAALDKPPTGKPNIVYGSEREDWIQVMLAAGMGCAVMPESMPLLPGIATRPLIEPEMSRTVALATVAGRRFPPPLAALLRLAQRHDWGAMG